MDEAVTRHYAESVWVGQQLPQIASAVDVGSGAGFPGIPVSIMRPEIQVTLVESHQRKAVFLGEATRDLPNVDVLSQRIESVSEHFDVLLARAVSWHDIGRVDFMSAHLMDVLVGIGSADAM